MRKRTIVLLILAGAFAAAQLYQPQRTNPPADPSASFEAVVKPPAHVQQVLARACQDCHSHRTEWPWYSRITPVNLLVARDVKEGRNHLNLSVWNIYSPEMSAIRQRAMCDEAKTGEMPPKYYTPLHPQARLNGEGVAAVCSLAAN